MRGLEFLDGPDVRRWCTAAAEALGAARDQIDALNVYPVADMDTGTNLHLTMLSAVRALDELPPSVGPQEVWQALAHGVLLGAQGNSGVLVSQYLRGLADVCAPASPCDGDAVRQGLAHAARLSRAAVGRPVEGTLLTVAAAGADAAAAAGSALQAVATAAAQGARRALVRTTAQLDVLARAGVVDAGGAGLCLLLDTFATVVTGTPAGPDAQVTRDFLPAMAGRPPLPRHVAGGLASYEVMYLLDAAEPDAARLRGELCRLGESVVVVGGGDLWNVHVHLADPGSAIEAGLAAGRPHRIRVTYLGVADAAGSGAAVPGVANAVTQPTGAPHQPPGGRAAASGSPGAGAGRRGRGGVHLTGSGHAVVAVAAGEPIAALLADAGAVAVWCPAGEELGPRDLMGAVREAGAPSGRVIVLPGEPRFAGVAHTVAAQARDEGITVAVVPTRSILQSMSALALYDPRRGFADDLAAMSDAAAATRWGQVTWAAAGPGGTEAIGWMGGGVHVPARVPPGAVPPGAVPPGAVPPGAVPPGPVVSGADALAVAFAVAERLLTGGGELVTLVSGSPGDPRAPAGPDVAAGVARRLEAIRPDVEIIRHDGGERDYLLLIGVE